MRRVASPVSLAWEMSCRGRWAESEGVELQPSAAVAHHETTLGGKCSAPDTDCKQGIASTISLRLVYQDAGSMQVIIVLFLYCICCLICFEISITESHHAHPRQPALCPQQEGTAGYCVHCTHTTHNNTQPVITAYLRVSPPACSQSMRITQRGSR